MNILNGMWPGVVHTYDPDSRSCRVEIPGITDGSDVRPEAVFNNPLGDNAAMTEIRILPGDPVWLMFEAGDPRFPIIMGYRTPRTGNPTGWRRWRHANIQLTAENQFVITVGATTITVTDGLVDIQGADMHLSGDLMVDGLATIGQTLHVAQTISNGGNVISQGGVAALGDIVSAANVGDQGGTKTMASMRYLYNNHNHVIPNVGWTTVPQNNLM